MGQETLRIALIQLNPTAGHFRKNLEAMLSAAKRAYEQGHDLVVFGPSSLSGFCAPRQRQALFFNDTQQTLLEEACSQLDEKLAELKGLNVIYDTFSRVTQKLLDESLGETKCVMRQRRLVKNGKLVQSSTQDQSLDAFCINGQHFYLGILDDQRYPSWEALCTLPAFSLPNAKTDGVVLLMAQTPAGLPEDMHTFFQSALPRFVKSHLRMPLLLAGVTGVTDQTMMPGATLAIDANGSIKGMLDPFECATLKVTIKDFQLSVENHKNVLWADKTALLYKGLVTSIRDYVEKCGFKGVVLGLSGGVDSALCAALAVDAIGAQRVRAVLMPSRFTTQESLEDARDLATRLDITLDTIAIDSLFEMTCEALKGDLAHRQWDTTEENIQARIRAVLLMAISNKNGLLSLCTSNKCEAAVGYGTLYGDVSGGYAPLIDIRKSMVWALCRYRNRQNEIIPERIITKAPSAELREGQFDQESLPEYPDLERILDGYLAGKNVTEVVEKTALPQEVVRRTMNMMRRAAFKRDQAPIGPIVENKPFEAVDFAFSSGNIAF